MTQGESLRRQLEEEYLRAFLHHRYVPVLVPSGQAVGDVIASLDGNYVARADECFTGLVPREAPGTLPRLDLSWSAAAELALGVDAIASAEAQGSIENRVQLTFEGVTVRSASLVQLRARVKPSVLPEVALMLAADLVTFDRAPDWLLLSQVVYATPTVRVKRARGGTAKADLGFLGRLFGGAVKARGGGQLNLAQEAEIRAPQPVPVAFRPARVRVTQEIAGSYMAVTAAAFNPNDEAHRHALADWAMRSMRPVSTTPITPPPPTRP